MSLYEVLVPLDSCSVAELTDFSRSSNPELLNEGKDGISNETELTLPLLPE